MVASSAPTMGKLWIINKTANGKKPRIGMDWRMSKMGNKSTKSFLFWLTAKPRQIEKIRESAYAQSIRRKVFAISRGKTNNSLPMKQNPRTQTTKRNIKKVRDSIGKKQGGENLKARW